MPPSTENHSGPDPETTLEQAAALATHLRRLGVRWLPTPDADSVDSLRAQLAVSDPATVSPVTSPESVSRAGERNTGKSVAGPLTGKPEAAPAAIPPASSPRQSFSLEGSDADQRQSYPGNDLPSDERTKSLAHYSDQVAACTRCEVLSKCRTKTVFGEGNVSPRVVFFGEGPGRDEDLSGRPFVGKAGQLLNKMIQACTFAREDVYIMNTVKCRPPNNRNPEPTEVENCREYFEAQLQLLRPEYIVCLGLVSAQALLQTKLSVGRMRGRFHNYFDSKVVVTYHPSYLLRTPAAKKAAWDDLQMMLRDAGLMESR